MDQAHLFAIGVLLAWLAGIRVYLTLFGVGLAGLLGWVDLPPALQATQSWWVLGTSGALALTEFFADKIPGVDSIWDLLQTLARVPAGAFLAAATLSPDGQLSTGVLAAGVAVALIGAMIVIRPGAGVFSWYAVLPLFCALSYATSALLTRKIGAQESVWASMVYASLFGTIVAGAALPFVWEPVAAADLWKFGLIACLGTGAQLCIIRSFSITEASVVAPFSYLGIVFATFWGAVLYGQWPDRWTVIGALVIVGAGLYVWHREHQASRAS